MPTIACIHTSTVFLTRERMMEDLFDELVPGVRRINLMDDAMLADVQAAGRIDDGVHERFRCCARAAEAAGADVILSLCSSLGPAAVAAAAEVEVPLLTIDQPMCAEAVTRARRILVLATVPTTLDPTIDRCRHEAAAGGHRVSLTPCLVAEAFPHLMAGDRQAHDALVLDRAAAAAAESELIVCAQASLTRLAPELAARSGLPVLTSPRSGIAQIAALLAARAAAGD